MAGWNELLTDKHAAARDASLEWMSIGKPRIGWEYELMKRSRAKFKLALAGKMRSRLGMTPLRIAI